MKSPANRKRVANTGGRNEQEADRRAKMQHDVATLFGTENPYADLFVGINKLIETRPIGGYRTLLLDPPWKFQNWSKKGELKNPERHYRTVPTEVIISLPIWKLAAVDAVCMLWTTAPLLHRQLPALAAWGFCYKSFVPWFKASPNSPGDIDDDDWNPSFGGGYIFRNCSELMLIGTRGDPPLQPERRSLRGAFFAPIREHSRKPDEQYDYAEALCAGPYLEIFSRTARPGWTAFGDEAGRWSTDNAKEKEPSHVDP
jgi:N6-adenosine-specific RNA methylase IME4